MGNIIKSYDYSGNFASFNTSLEYPLDKLNVHFNPIQDLSRYGSPYPAGGGKNLIPYPFYSADGQYGTGPQSRIGTFSTESNGHISYSAIRTSDVSIILANGLSLNSGTYTLSFTSDLLYNSLIKMHFEISDSNNIEIGRVTSSSTTFTFTIEEDTNVTIKLVNEGVNVRAAVDGYLQLEAGSSATDYAPYENICPIRGCIGMSVKVCGENLLNIPDGYSTSAVGATFTGDDNGGIVINGTTTSTAILYINNGLLRLKKDITYYLSGGYTEARLSLSTSAGEIIDSGNGAQYTPTEDETVRPYLKIDTNCVFTNRTINPMITTTPPSEFSPYSGNLIPLSWDSTAGIVYGGEVDFVSGKLIVDRASVDLGTMNWRYSSTRKVFTTSDLNDAKPYSMAHKKVGLVCSQYKGDYIDSVYNGEVDNACAMAQYYVSNIMQNNLMITNFRYVDVNEFTAAMSGVQLVYELAEPIEYQLSPQEIKTFIGHNNIYSNEEVDTELDVSYYDYVKATNETSGGIVSFDTDIEAPLEELKVELSPVQDLNGQEYPYPAGGGKNLLPDISRSNTYYNCTVVFDNNSCTFIGTANGSGGRNIFRSEYFSLKAGTYYFKKFDVNARDKEQPAVYLQNNTSIVTANSQTGMFVLDADSSNMNIGVNVSDGAEYNYSATFAISKENITSYAPYENLCPISGHTEVDAQRTGKNLLPTFSGYSANGLTSVVNADGSIRVTGIATGGGGYITGNNMFTKISKGTTITWSIGTVLTGRIRAFFRNKTQGSVLNRDINAGSTSDTTTLNVDIYGVQLYFSTTAGTTYDFTIFPQLELGSTASPYEAYNGQSVTYTLGQTVYAGTLTVNEDGSGRIVATYGKHTFDGADSVGLANWKPTEGTSAWLYTPSVTPNLRNIYTDATNRGNLLCDTLKTVPYNTTSEQMQTATIPCISVVGTVNWGIAMRVTDTSLTTASAINEYLASNPIEIVYKLETPVTIQLTAQEVLDTLIGCNNIYSTAGDVSVKYTSYDTAEESTAMLDFRRNILLNTPHVESATGNPATFETDMNSKLEECKVEFAPVQESEPWISSTAEKKPYLYRAAKDTVEDLGNRVYDNIVGGTIAWNQLVPDTPDDKTVSGYVVSIDDGAPLAAKSVTFEITPQQDLNGQEYPYPAGGGKNKIAPLTTVKTFNGVTATCSYETETITITGTAISNGGRSNALTPIITLPSGTYYFSASDGRTASYTLNKADNTFIAGVNVVIVLEEETSVYVGVNVTNGTTYNETVKIQLEEGSTATEWTPYSNICPITAHESLTAYDDPAYGGKIVWNQNIEKNDNKYSVTPSTETSSYDLETNTVSWTCNYSNGRIRYMPFPNMINHVYLVGGIFSSDKGSTLQFQFTRGWAKINFPVTTTPTLRYGIVKPTAESDVYNYCQFFVSNPADYPYVCTIKDFQIIDLTKMFGETVADYVYNLEQTTSGAGIAWFKNLFPNDYYEYNAGTETTVSAVNGNTYRELPISLAQINIWDEQWEVGTFNTSTGASISRAEQIRCKNLIPVVGGESYYFNSTMTAAGQGMWTIFYDDSLNIVTPPTGLPKDGNSVLIQKKAVTIPSDASYIKFYLTNTYGNTYNNDVAINYPATDTDYHPYIPEVYGGELAINEDGSATFTQTYTSVDLGTLNYYNASSSESGVYRMRSTTISDIAVSPNNVVGNILCENYRTLTANQTYTKNVGISVELNKEVSIYDPTYQDAAAFKTAMSGVQLVYKLAEPVTYTLSAQQVLTLFKGSNNVWCDTGGTTLDYYSLHDQTLTSGKKYLVRIGGEESIITGTGQSVQAECGEDNIHDLTSMFGGEIADEAAINIWDEEWEVGGYTWATGNKALSTSRIRNKNFIPVIPNTQYFVKMPSNLTGLNIFLYDKNKTFLRYFPNSFSNAVITIPQEVYYINFFASNENYGTTYNNDISINYPSTDHDYHQYGVKWLKSYGYFKKNHYPYNAGELISVKTSAHKITGFNLWDEEWEAGMINDSDGQNRNGFNDRIRSKNYIRIEGGKTYSFRRPAGAFYIYYYDDEKNYISPREYKTVNDFFTTSKAPDNASYCRFYVYYALPYNNDICINISSARNGEYEPYSAQTSALSDIELRGLPQLDTDGIYYDGDVYKSSGGVTRNYGIANLGTASWSLNTTEQTASGDIVSVSDGAAMPVKQAVFEIEPVQDLHGQEYPYPAGGGKNLLNPSYFDLPDRYIVNNDESISVLVNDGRAWSIVEPLLLKAGTYYLKVFGQTAYSQYRISEDDYQTNYSVQGNNTATFTLQADGAIKLKLDLSTTIERPTTVKVLLTTDSAVTEWTPYENICPISGHTSLDAFRTGVNVFSEETEVGGINPSTGLNTSDTDRIRSTKFPVLPSTSYYVAFPSNVGGIYVCYYKTSDSYDFISAVFCNSAKAVTTPDNCKYIRFATQGAYGNVYHNDISINYPSTDHDYHPHKDGKLINWNQLVKNGNFENVSVWNPYGGGSYTVSNNVATLTGGNGGRIYQDMPSGVLSHKLLFTADIKGDGTNGAQVYVDGIGSPARLGLVTSDSWTTVSAVRQAGASGIVRMQLYIISDSTISVNLRNAMCFDLTEMFGAETADYVYNLEQTTSGAGVAWFKNKFPNDYYAYNPGEETTVNAVNGTPNKFATYQLGDTVYGGTLTINEDGSGQIVATYTKLVFDGSVDESWHQWLAGKAYYVIVPTEGADNPQSMMSNQFKWVGIRSGAPSDFAVGEFLTNANVNGDAGIWNGNVSFKFDETGSDLAAFKAYLSNHPIELLYKIEPVIINLTQQEVLTLLAGSNNVWCDTGATSITYNALESDRVFTTTLGKKSGLDNFAISCPEYTKLATAAIHDNNMSTVGSADSGTISIRDDSYDTVEDFTAAMDGQQVVYELAEATTDSADSFTSPLEISEWSTEEYIDERSVAIPVGHESYHANECEIEGWTGVDVTVGGKNLFDVSKATIGEFVRAGNVSEQSPLGSTTGNGGWSCSDYILVEPQKTYTTIVPHYINASAAGLVFYADKSVESAISGVTTTYQPSNGIYTFTTPQNCKYVRFSWGNNNGNECQFELGSTATAYEPYIAPTTHQYSWDGSIGIIDDVQIDPQTGEIISSEEHDASIVYGGYVDLASGKLVATYAEVDLGTLTWMYYGSITGSNIFYGTLDDSKFRFNYLTESYARASNNVVLSFLENNHSLSGAGAGHSIWIRDDSYTDVSVFKAAMTGQQLIYELAEPIEFELTAEQIKTLVGTNNVSSNTNGNVTVKYWKH